MHLSIIIMALSLAIFLRFWLWQSPKTSTNRWNRALSAFLVPPLLLLVTAITMILMGTDGVMLGISVGRLGFLIGVGGIGIASILLAYLGIQGWRSLWRVRTYPIVNVRHHTGRLLDVPIPFAGQVGFWTPELVVSRGLLTTLTPAQVNAVLTHEAAHAVYRDTFWFFWLGWLRRLTCWLPLTQILWQELLLLRELRADQWATQSVDSLMLAEALLEVVKTPAQVSFPDCVAFGTPSLQNRLAERIDALLQGHAISDPGLNVWRLKVWIAFIPMLAIALHH